MSFSQAFIHSVRAYPEGGDLAIEWSSSAPAGTVFQVYVDRRLSWSGTARRCHTPIPAGSLGRNVWVDLATVAADESARDFSSQLGSPATATGTVQLSWSGGTYLDPTGADDVVGFRIYRSPGPGLPVNTAAPVANLLAYPGGWVSDGYGLGGFGEGGFGRSAGSYSWTSTNLSPGLWRFRVVPYGRSLVNRGNGQDVLADVRVPPRPPARDDQGSSLTYEYSGPTSRSITLSWRPSPSA